MKITRWMRVAAAIAMTTASAAAFDLSLLDDDTNFHEGTVHAPKQEEEREALIETPAPALGSLTASTSGSTTSFSASGSTASLSASGSDASGSDLSASGSASASTSGSSASLSTSASDASTSDSGSAVSASGSTSASTSGSSASLSTSGSAASLSMSGSAASYSSSGSAASTSTAASLSSSGSAPSVASSSGSAATPTTGSGGFLAPFATEEPPETLFPRDALGEMAPIINVAKGLLGKPLPTNKWWGNMIHTTAEEMNTKANPGWSNPYAVKLPKEAPYGIQACYSYNYRQLSALTDGVAEFYLHDFVNDITLSAAEFTAEAKPIYEVYSFSDFGIEVRACLENKEQCMDSALVHGMAFITATYDRLTARIESEYTMEIVDKSVPGKYIVELGGNQTWVVYTDKKAKFALDETGKALVSSAVYTGTVRAAILPSAKATSVYDKYRTCHVRGGNISVESRTEYSLQWETVGKSCGTHGLLHFALPHHLPALKGAIKAKSRGAIVLNSATRGKMVAQVTTTGSWSLSEPEDDLEADFYPTVKPSAKVVSKIGLLKTLESDIAEEWSLNKTSWYFNGKMYQNHGTKTGTTVFYPFEASLACQALALHLDPVMTISIHEAYNTLGLTRDATADQVKRAYRKLALQFHPDKNPDPAATAKFQQLSAAYKRVDDHLKREPSAGDREFEDFFGGDFDGEFEFDDDLDMPSMDEMLFMFDMLFGASPPGRSRKNGKKNGGVRVNLRRKGKRQVPQEPPGFPSYVDQELMDMFAHGMMFDGAGAGLEDEFMSFFEHSGVAFGSKSPTWSSDDEEVERGPLKQAAKASPSSPNECSKHEGSAPTIGSKVCIHGKHSGVVMFTGNVHYAKGEFVGVALSSPVGKNDGSIKGVRYFECSPSHGLMVRPNDVTQAA
ncbi:hypothetical protein PRIC2_011645 [Phytophthora ramorum]